jgi:hypothetical protein
MKRSGFKNRGKPLRAKKPWGYKRKPFGSVARKNKVKVAGKPETKEIKDDIQALLRQLSIIRDEGCVLRLYPDEAGQCGGYGKKSGKLILQFDHLNSRSHSISFGDLRLGVCVCYRHHFHFKKQYPAKYERLIRMIIGEKRCKLLDLVREDRRAHKVDWKLVKIDLEQQLKELRT